VDFATVYRLSVSIYATPLSGGLHCKHEVGAGLDTQALAGFVAVATIENPPVTVQRYGLAEPVRTNIGNQSSEFVTLDQRKDRCGWAEADGHAGVFVRNTSWL
jgi:hypothetical protein